jgi:hypothetical protein
MAKSNYVFYTRIGEIQTKNRGGTAPWVAQLRVASASLSYFLTYGRGKRWNEAHDWGRMFLASRW